MCLICLVLPCLRWSRAHSVSICAIDREMNSAVRWSARRVFVSRFRRTRMPHFSIHLSSNALCHAPFSARLQVGFFHPPYSRLDASFSLLSIFIHLAIRGPSCLSFLRRRVFECVRLFMVQLIYRSRGKNHGGVGNIYIHGRKPVCALVGKSVATHGGFCVCWNSE